MIWVDRHSRSIAVGVLALALSLAAACTNATPPRLMPAVGVVADTGFRPAENGFAFANYGVELANGSTPINMTPSDVRTMFGASVCVDKAARQCQLIPPAAAWLDSVNTVMAAGHCYGLAVTALMLWRQRARLNMLGASTAPALTIIGNTLLQRLIAYNWTLQTLAAVRSARIGGTPNEVLAKLTKSLTRRSSETYTAILLRPHSSAGHAVVPYAVEREGTDKVKVFVYDSNWPGATRAMVFDTKADTWRYEAGGKTVYRGSADIRTLFVDPTSPGLGRQPCPFCDKVPTSADPGHASTNRGVDEVSLIGSSEARRAAVFITDRTGRRLGEANGNLVQEIAGGRVEPLVADSTNTAPNLFVPSNRQYTITIDASRLAAPTRETLTMVGPSFDVSVRNLTVAPGEKYTLAVDPKAAAVTYTSSQADTPTLELGISYQRADYSLQLRGIGVGPGHPLVVTLPVGSPALSVRNANAVDSRVQFTMTRLTPAATLAFANNQLLLAAGETATFHFAGWLRAAEAMPVTTRSATGASTRMIQNQSTSR